MAESGSGVEGVRTFAGGQLGNHGSWEGGGAVDSGISIFRPFCRDSPRLCQVLPHPHPLPAQDKDFIVRSRIHYTSFDISTPPPLAAPAA